MNEIKGYFTAIFIIIFWSAMCGFCGYLFSNSRAIGKLNEANQHLAELQQEYDRAIATAKQQTELANKQLRDIGDQLSKQVQSSGRATQELSAIIEQIRKQKLNVQV